MWHIPIKIGCNNEANGQLPMPLEHWHRQRASTLKFKRNFWQLFLPTDYIYSLANVNIETDHKPLRQFSGNLLVKPRSVLKGCFQVCKSSTWRSVKYPKGPQLLIADTLSRAFIHEVSICIDSMELDRLDLRSELLIFDERWQQFETGARNDPIQ